MKLWNGLTAIALSIMVSTSRAAAEPVSVPELTPLMKAPPITLQSGDLTMRFQPGRAWTFDEMRFQGNLLNNPGSFTGLVLNFGGAKFLGSGHTEAGREQVLAVSLKVDGKVTDALHGGTFKGSSIELVKESTLATTHLKSVLRLQDGALECEQFLTPQEETELDKIYAFMFPWTTQTTEWMALTTGGRKREGNFDSGSWQLTDNVQWSAIYNPQYQVAAVTIFPPDSQIGAGVKHGYWNVQAYHKEYYQPAIQSPLPKDVTLHWQAKVLLLAAEQTHWKEAVTHAVATNAARL